MSYQGVDDVHEAFLLVWQCCNGSQPDVDGAQGYQYPRPPFIACTLKQPLENKTKQNKTKQNQTKQNKTKQNNRTEQTTSFGVNSMRSQVLYRAAQADDACCAEGSHELTGEYASHAAEQDIHTILQCT